MYDPDEDVDKFDAVERICKRIWPSRASFWTTVLFVWIVIMVVCYL